LFTAHLLDAKKDIGFFIEEDRVIRDATAFDKVGQFRPYCLMTPDVLIPASGFEFHFKTKAFHKKRLKS